MLEHIHGGNIYKASELYGFRKEDFLDYSANINPLGLPPSLKELLLSNIDNLVNYPDIECTGLKKEISGYLRLPENRIIIGNGASEIIFLLFEVLRPGRVLIPAPSFSEYAKAAGRYGVGVEYFELREEEEFKLDLNALFQRMSGGIDAVFICNPNNPTSTLMGREDLLQLLDYALESGICIIIDEAFIELTVGGNKNSISDVLDRYNNLFIIRAFTKLFAIPGLRLGYGLGSEDIIRRMWKIKMPWSVNSLACCVGSVLRDEKYLHATSAWLEEEIEWFYRELSLIAGLKVFKPDTNFILIKILGSSLNVKELKDRMALKGILIRDAGNFVFLNEKFFRLAVKDRESNKRLLKTLREVVE